MNKRKDGNVSGLNKWSEYGCFCNPHHERIENSSWSGKGEPVDRIDYMCRQLWWGYRCIQRDYTACTAEEAYSWTFEAGKIRCLETEGSCRGDLCRLDALYALEISTMKKRWKAENHVQNGFDRSLHCLPATVRNARIQKEKLPGQGGEVGQEESTKTTRPGQCCGSGLQRVIFKPDRAECCRDGLVRPLGNC